MEKYKWNQTRTKTKCGQQEEILLGKIPGKKQTPPQKGNFGQTKWSIAKA